MSGADRIALAFNVARGRILNFGFKIFRQLATNFRMPDNDLKKTRI